jgi:antitoxin (DNA-binding transcriptional repressor) of toxin-antitoxin stability system
VERREIGVEIAPPEVPVARLVAHARGERQTDRERIEPVDLDRVRLGSDPSATPG